jgi:hypothetical protein
MLGKTLLSDQSRRAQVATFVDLMSRRRDIWRAINGVVIHDELARITAPTLVVVGEKDVATPPAEGEADRRRDRRQSSRAVRHGGRRSQWIGDEWIQYTSEGYFNVSPGGAELVSVVVGDHAYEIDQLAAQYNRPDVLLERFGLSTPQIRDALGSTPMRGTCRRARAG